MGWFILIVVSAYCVGWYRKQKGGDMKSWRMMCLWLGVAAKFAESAVLAWPGSAPSPFTKRVARVVDELFELRRIAGEIDKRAKGG